MATKIEWAEDVWNPIAGCNDVSEGCRNCYARGMAKRLAAMGQEKYKGLTVLQGSKTVWTGKISFDERAMFKPIQKKKPTRYFVNSMSDLFHPNVPDEIRDQIFTVMAICSQHTFLVLTKRPDIAREYLEKSGKIEDIYTWWHSYSGTPAEAEAWPLPNVWLGVSGEDQKTVTNRAWTLLQTPAAVRFLSLEPMLGPVDLDAGELLIDKRRFTHTIGNYLDWVIVGGESGHKARIMHPDWARTVRDQCKTAGVAFFFKQWGEWIPWEPENMPCWVSQHGKCEDQHALFPADIVDDPPGWDSGLGYEGQAAFQRVGKKSAGDLLDGVQYHEFPEARDASV